MTSGEIIRERVLITDIYQADQEITRHIEFFSSDLNKRLEMTCGYTDVDLEGRFEFLRTQETNLGNWIADVFYTEFMQCDIVVLNSGSLRSNQLMQRGHLTLKDIA